MGEAIRLQTRPLFTDNDIDLEHFNPVFTEQQMNLSIVAEEYSIPLGMGGTVFSYTVKLPNGMDVSLSRSEENQWYGNSIELINEFIRENKDSSNPTDQKAIVWIRDNSNNLNIALHYWRAYRLRKSVELTLLTANVAAAQVEQYSVNKRALNDEEIKRIVLGLGYDPELSWGYL